ncbi:MAG: hypothetical protein JST04_15280 [Bdellovibrionales bacterium]|nr:hypothetical protein [Bdellovibrionales bacterium]
MTKLPLELGLFTALFLASATSAFAFPEMIRHGYPNCTSCHVSPSGGGVLTSYGRQLSGELMSMTTSEKDANFLHGILKSPEWLLAGGDVRSIEIYRNTPQVRAYRFLNMQADLEAAATLGKFTADVSGGFYMLDPGFHRYYLNYRPTDELSFRVGRFRQAYGLMDPNHTSPIHRGLGWDEGTESYNLEAAWLGENLNAHLTGNFGAATSLVPNTAKEKGVALRVGKPLGERSQLGISAFRAKSDLATRTVAGPFAIVGISPRIFLLSEVDYQRISPDSARALYGWVTWNRFDYEFVQGLHGYLTLAQSRVPSTDGVRPNTYWGVGSQWFPRPHFEFDFQWQFQSVREFPDDELTYATLLLHYYL